MSKQLQKINRKSSLRVDIDACIFKAIHLLWKRELPAFASFSSFSEAVIFLVEGAQIAKEDDSLIFHLRDLKAQRLLSLSNLRQVPATRELHMTLSQPAMAYLDYLRKAFPVVFGSRAEVLSLMYLAVLELRDRSDNAVYLQRRLTEATKNHSAETFFEF